MHGHRNAKLIHLSFNF